MYNEQTSNTKREKNNENKKTKEKTQESTKEENRMAVLAKPTKNLIVVDAKSSRDFIERFNKNTITPKMLESCAKADRLFKRNGKQS